MKSSRLKKRSRLFLFACAASLIFTSYSIIIYEQYFYHMRSPVGSGVGHIIYKKTKVFGRGPGGNETGIVIFTLNSNSVQALKTKPEEFLASLPKSTKKCRFYKNWKETPLIAQETNISGTTTGKPITLEAFMNRRGFGIPISNEYRSIIDAAFSQGGSFIGSRCGSFVFIPDAKLAAYIFVG